MSARNAISLTTACDSWKTETKHEGTKVSCWQNPSHHPSVHRPPSGRDCSQPLRRRRGLVRRVGRCGPRAAVCGSVFRRLLRLRRTCRWRCLGRVELRTSNLTLDLKRQSSGLGMSLSLRRDVTNRINFIDLLMVGRN